MKCFWDDRQRAHAPSGEFFNGAMHPAAEHPGRVDAILQAIGPTEAPTDRGMEPLLRVHSADYLDFLRTAHDEWRAAGREGDAFPYTFPVVGRRPLNLQPHRRTARPVQLRHLDADRGENLGCGLLGGADRACGSGVR